MNRTQMPFASQLEHDEAMSRRRFLGTAVVSGFMIAQIPLRAADAIAASSVNPPPQPVRKTQRYKIAAVDLMMLKRQKLGALPLAHELGLDGVEVDMGGLGERPTFDNKLVDPVVRKQFLDTTAELGLELCSLGMTGFYAQSFAERLGIERTMRDCFETARAMGVKIVFLPLGIKGDLVKHPELRPAVVARLKEVAPFAAEAGVVIGLETALDAAAEVKLLDEVGSPAVRSYFNFSNALQNGRDLHQELRILGRDRICQIHCTNQDGVWLQNDPKLEMPKVKQTLDELGWSGWLVIERSRDAKEPSNVRKNFGANAAYLKSIFQPS